MAQVRVCDRCKATAPEEHRWSFLYIYGDIKKNKWLRVKYPQNTGSVVFDICDKCNLELEKWFNNYGL